MFSFSLCEHAVRSTSSRELPLGFHASWEPLWPLFTRFCRISGLFSTGEISAYG